jgi:hypothetical protein
MFEAYPEVQFRWQRDPKYQFLVEDGIVASLDESQVCWLACIEMATSPALPDEVARLKFIRSYATEIKNLGRLDEQGRADTLDTPKSLAIWLELRDRWNLPTQVAFLQFPPRNVLVERLMARHIISLSVTRPERGTHQLLFDRVYVHPTGNEVLSFLDPAVSNPVDARCFITHDQIDEEFRNGAKWDQYLLDFVYS